MIGPSPFSRLSVKDLFLAAGKSLPRPEEAKTMPMYEYWCDAHGGFSDMRPMAEYDKPGNCPDCGAAAPRVLLTPPRVLRMDAVVRHSHSTNEQAADSPKRLSTHGPGCSCCSGGTKSSRKALHRSDGSKSFPSARPWMISH
jgi:putative FmdB family regulatory protein